MPTAIGPAEAAVLRACARRRAQLHDAALPVDAEVDWDALLRAAEVHGVTELLVAPLTSAGAGVPRQVVAFLQRRAIEVTGLNLNRATQLAGLLRLFSSRGIDALAFKGLPLGIIAYGHLSRRHSSDIDLFFRRRDLPRIRPLLLAEGYRLRPPAHRRGGSLLYGRFPAVGRDEELLPGRPWDTTVDIHVAFARWSFGIRCDTQGFFDRATSVDVAGYVIPTLRADDLLPVLAIHGMMHSWWPLRLVSDIDALVEVVDNWQEVVERADAARMRRVLWVALLLAKQLLGTALPPDVDARATRDREAMRIVRWAAAKMYVLEDPTNGWFARPWLRCFAPDRLSQRLRYYAVDTAYAVLKWPWNDGQADASHP